MILGIAMIGAAMVWFVHTRGQLVCAHCVYENYGVAGTSVLYLPGSLLGCLIAETQRPLHEVDERRRLERRSDLYGHGVRPRRRPARRNERPGFRTSRLFEQWDGPVTLNAWPVAATHSSASRMRTQ